MQILFSCLYLWRSKFCLATIGALRFLAQLRLRIFYFISEDNMKGTKQNVKALVALMIFVVLAIVTLVSCGETAPVQTEHVHEFGEWTVTKNPTCAEPGEQERLCSCGEKQTQAIPIKEHTIVIDAAVAPTCTSTGRTEGSHCSVCGKVISAQTTVPMVAHTYGEAVMTKAPTCSEAGVNTYTCTVCGQTKTENIASRRPPSAPARPSPAFRPP